MALGDKKQAKLTFDRKGEKRTSIGRSKNSRPRNKHKRRSFKPYRGQGMPK